MAVLWRVALSCPAFAEDFAAALTDPDATVATMLDEAAGFWHVEAILPHAPDRAELELRLALVAAAAGCDAPAVAIEPLPDVDWLAHNRESFRPIVVGPFVVHGEHADPEGARLPLRIDAATAFGTGEHATTQGCLLALVAAARRRRIRRALDMGTGSGVLAIALAKLARARVLAVDIDPESVAVARRHARHNGVAGLVRVAPSVGYRAAAIRRGAPYDLVLANILARPLAAMAGDLARVLAPGGRAILSGLLVEHERWVLAAQRRHGLALVARIRIAGWSTLTVARRG